jgi:hypothetical protein
MTDKNSVKMHQQVFISYSTPDRQVADLICPRLESENIRCWLPHRDTLPGERWIYEITKTVKKSKLVVLFFSSNTKQSQWVKDEFVLAFEKKLKIIPFQVKDTSTPQYPFDSLAVNITRHRNVIVMCVSNSDSLQTIAYRGDMEID